MDSAGLGALIGGIRKVENDGVIAVFCDRANTRLLHTTGFDRIVPVCEDLPSAVARSTNPRADPAQGTPAPSDRRRCQPAVDGASAEQVGEQTVEVVHVVVQHRHSHQHGIGAFGQVDASLVVGCGSGEVGESGAAPAPGEPASSASIIAARSVPTPVVAALRSTTTPEASRSAAGSGQEKAGLVEGVAAGEATSTNAVRSSLRSSRVDWPGRKAVFHSLERLEERNGFVDDGAHHAGELAQHALRTGLATPISPLLEAVTTL